MCSGWVLYFMHNISEQGERDRWLWRQGGWAMMVVMEDCSFISFMVSFPISLQIYLLFLYTVMNNALIALCLLSLLVYANNLHILSETRMWLWKEGRKGLPSLEWNSYFLVVFSVNLLQVNDIQKGPPWEPELLLLLLLSLQIQLHETKGMVWEEGMNYSWQTEENSLFVTLNFFPTCFGPRRSDAGQIDLEHWICVSLCVLRPDRMSHVSAMGEH